MQYTERNSAQIDAPGTVTLIQNCRSVASKPQRSGFEATRRRTQEHEPRIFNACDQTDVSRHPRATSNLRRMQQSSAARTDLDATTRFGGGIIGSLSLGLIQLPRK